jgi:Mn2+/Fe2+ NRAMP family transporter
MPRRKHHAHAPSQPEKPWWRQLGPGIVSGASDNDPTTVASLSVIGATTTYALGWLVILVVPMLAIVQAISSEIGAVCREGLEDILKKHYGRWASWSALVALLAVNWLTLVADIEAGGAGASLIFGNLDFRWFVIPIAAFCITIVIALDYERVQHILVVIPLVFLGYIIAGILAHPNWHDVLVNSFVPHIVKGAAFAQGAIALLGTTLTAYAYVWEEIEISEERPPLRRLGLVQVDATLGTIIAGLSFWFIIIATGATLGVHHHQVQTAQDAALGLQPFAGRWAPILFGLGLLGSSLIAVPVLAATTAYVVAELFGWRRGISKHFGQAPRFFLVFSSVVVTAVIAALFGLSPIKLLFASSIAGGLATPVTLFLMMLVASNNDIMRRHAPPLWLRIAGWAVFAVVTSAAGLFLIQTFTGKG